MADGSPHLPVGSRIRFTRQSGAGWAADGAVPIGSLGTILAVDTGDSSYQVRWDEEHYGDSTYWIAWGSAGREFLPDLTDPGAVADWLANDEAAAP